MPHCFEARFGPIESSEKAPVHPLFQLQLLSQFMQQPTAIECHYCSRHSIRYGVGCELIAPTLLLCNADGDQNACLVARNSHCRCTRRSTSSVTVGEIIFNITLSLTTISCYPIYTSCEMLVFINCACHDCQGRL